MIQFNIKGGTPPGGKSLCVTCKHSSSVRGQNMEEVIHCTAGLFEHRQGLVPFKVSECTEFHPSNMPWLHEMEEMAWKIEARKRGVVGFEGEKVGEMEVVVSKPKSAGE